jgi:sugar O-acyltransferase (sialic acid O-acetyltransferase NeuD family)
VPETPLPVTIPLINPNEPEALLASLAVHEGQPVEAGQVLCTLETTKSTQELLAEADGYVVGLRLSQGQSAVAGEILCYLSPSADWTPPEASTLREIDTARHEADSLPAGLRITQPALSLAQQTGLDLKQLPIGPLVTESQVRRILEQAPSASAWSVPDSDFDPTALVIYGGGGHGKSLIDLVRLVGIYRLVGVIDDGLARGDTILGLPVLGGGDVLPELHATGVRLAINAVGGIGDSGVRIKVFRRLAEAGFTCPPVVHPRAHVEASAVLSPGVQVFAHAYIGSDCRVGYGAIVNTGAILSHDCRLGDYVNISPGAILAGEVKVGAAALIGMGATINLRVRVGAGARIGNGATVKSDLPERGIVRAGSIWPAS